MGYFRRGALIERFTSIATAGSTTTLLNNSTTIQLFTGTLAQTIALPDATTCDGGSNNTGSQKFIILNRSTGILTVNNNAGTRIATVAAGADLEIHLTSDTTAAGVWRTSPYVMDQPLKLSASATPDANINISANAVINPNGSDTNTSPISNLIPTVVASTHNLQTGATTGATFSGATLPSSTT